LRNAIEQKNLTKLKELLRGKSKANVMGKTESMSKSNKNKVLKKSEGDLMRAKASGRKDEGGSMRGKTSGREEETENKQLPPVSVISATNEMKNL